jgi:hypothetical protein
MLNLNNTSILKIGGKIIFSSIPSQRPIFFTSKPMLFELVDFMLFHQSKTNEKKGRNKIKRTLKEYSW